MAYCVIGDVQALNAQRGAYSGTTKPSINDVNAFIIEIAEEIDSVLVSVGVSVPVTGTTVFLKRLNVMGAAAMAEASMAMDGTTESIEARNWRWSIYQEGLKDIRTNPAIVGVMPAAVTTSGARSDYTSGFTNTNAEFTSSGGMW